MSNKEKQIEEMAKLISQYVIDKGRKVSLVGTMNEELLEMTHNTGIAEAFYEAGYRKEQETVKEVFGEIASFNKTLTDALVENGLYNNGRSVEIICEKIKSKLAEKLGIEI